MGQCGDLLILSAPSAVMAATERDDVYFYVHTVGVDASGRVGLAEPERVEVRRLTRESCAAFASLSRMSLRRESSACSCCVPRTLRGLWSAELAF